ncbi:unnamed protein product [Knipowitschia caucasica]|uniref:Zinc finger matrin-type protein 5 n=1 Tax=Knipowitschia caucasica TaxID=637954 RepID=A0AAV2IVY8_KNICA
MGKRYYCDYCDRSFQSTLPNIKKHVNGVQHHRAKKAWFDNFRDAATILTEEQAKKRCRTFLQNGVCDFGSTCRFSHMTDEDFSRLRQQATGENPLQDQFKDSILAKRSLEDWLSRREQKTNSLCSKEDTRTDLDFPEESVIPLELLRVPDLPPSLQSPPPGGWRASGGSGWG